MHVTLLLDGAMHDAFKVLAPTFTILDADNPDTLSSAIKMPNPVIGTIANWFIDGDLKLTEYHNEKTKRVQSKRC